MGIANLRFIIRTPTNMDDTMVWLKVICVLAVSVAFHVTVSPPTQSKAEERIPTTNFLERYLAVAQRYLFLVKIFPWVIGVAEIVTILSGNDIDLSLSSTSIVGLVLVLFGGWLRSKCYQAMGENFTFDLTIRQKHNLVTKGPYSFVRHPSYLASTLVFSGLGIWWASPGSWIIESGFVRTIPGATCIALFASCLTTVCSGLISRIPGEDERLKSVFGKQWDDWVQRVPCAVIPGLL